MALQGMHRFFNPVIFGTEFVYTLVVVVLCLLVYFKTKEMYDLTKHDGIRYFRYAFLLFGLTYAVRFILHLTQLSVFAFDYLLPRGALFPIMIVFLSYLSTMAIFFLAYSVVWKKLNLNTFIALSTLLAVLVSITAFFSRSPLIVSLLQVPLIIFILAVTRKKKTGILYVLVSLFWLFSLFILTPGRVIPSEIKIILEIASIAVFYAVYRKVSKWTK